MSDSILTLSSEKILSKVFHANIKGYDSDEVDSFLDEVVKDYATFSKYFKESKEYIVNLETKLRKAEEDIKDFELEIAKMHNKLDAIKDKDNVDSTNITLMDYIAKMEKALYNLGVDPTALK